MTPEKQRIAIAEACGWTCCGHVAGCAPHGLHPSRNVHDYSFKQVMEMEVPIGDLPDYPSNLNAMHEAEKVLINAGLQKWWDYCDNLVKICPANIGKDCAFHATAAQKAEAFLRTLGKWEEEPK